MGDGFIYLKREFQLRGEVQSPELVIRSATSINAEIIQMNNEIGIIKPGAIADILVVNGNPLKNLQLLREEGAHLDVIMKDGESQKNNLDARHRL